jgi:hypothetical protein
MCIVARVMNGAHVTAEKEIVVLSGSALRREGAAEVCVVCSTLSATRAVVSSLHETCLVFPSDDIYLGG